MEVTRWSTDSKNGNKAAKINVKMNNFPFFRWKFKNNYTCKGSE